MGENSSEMKWGCGICIAVFGKRNFWHKRSTSTGSLQILESSSSNNNNVKTSSSNIKRRRSGSDGVPFFNSPVNIVEAPPKPRPKQPASVHRKNQVVRRPPDHEATKTTTTGKRVPKEAVSISGELETMIMERQKAKGNSHQLVRATSNNMMLYGNLGNLRQPAASGGGGKTNSSQNGKLYPNSVMGNVVKKLPVEENRREEEQPAAASLCKTLSTRMDPETLKIMGNEDYKNGGFAEALALYEAAIAIDPNKASYRSNKSAALAALGRLIEAVFECREAIRIEPRYHRAHHRLANLYLRLADAESAIYHYKHAGPEADSDDIAKAKTLQAHLIKCTEAKRLRDWKALLKETESTISAGADSAPQIYALKAEALLKLRRHQEADETLLKGPNFNVDDCTRYFGTIGNANLLVVRAQVDMAAGRFDDALAATERAVRLDSTNKEANTVMRKTRAVAVARWNGNEHFKASEFWDACSAYGEGLEHDPHNSVLLCNRAACRSKLGHFEKAIEDCTHALNLRPGYTKARLRRADCNFKLEKWEASVQDYEMLLRERPDNEEVKQALSEAQMQLKTRCVQERWSRHGD